MARRHAEARSAYEYELRVVLDDTTDGTAAIVRGYDGVTLLDYTIGETDADLDDFVNHRDRVDTTLSRITDPDDPD